MTVQFQNVADVILVVVVGGGIVTILVLVVIGRLDRRRARLQEKARSKMEQAARECIFRTFDPERGITDYGGVTRLPLALLKALMKELEAEQRARERIRFVASERDE